jgi:excisionase family DNA binding protein
VPLRSLKQAPTSFDELRAEHLAMKIVRLLSSTAKADSPWLKAPEAATYLRCPLSRIRKLTATGALPSHRDGGRVLYRAEELDAFVRDGGATS